MNKYLVAASAALAMTSTSAQAQDYAAVSGSDRVSYVASNNQKGNTVPIPIADITRLCGDMDGCRMRIGMYNWDGQGRVASRDFMFFYNPVNRNWRASLGDTEGTDNNSAIQHVNNSWTCYVTDGEYLNSNGIDNRAGFGLLVWTQFNADCWLTIID